MSKNSLRSAKITGSVAHFLRILVTVLAVFSVEAGSAEAQMMKIIAEGREDYKDHCAACHGEAGKGDGAMAKSLVVPPGDLTQLAKDNKGVFPFSRVYAIIVGETAVAGHSTFQMPIFSERFRRDESKPGYLPGYVRSLLVTHYLQSKQE